MDFILHVPFCMECGRFSDVYLGTHVGLLGCTVQHMSHKLPPVQLSELHAKKGS